MNLILEAKNKFNKLASYKYFDEVYILLLALIAIIGWCYSSIVAMSILLSISAVILFISNDFKYIIPSTIYSLFCINEGFNNNEVPIPIIVVAVLLLIVMIVEAIKNKISFKSLKGGFGLLGLAIINIIPIFWANIPKDYSIFYVFFFGNAIYFLVYIVFSSGIKSNAKDFLAKSISYLGLLIAMECVIKVISLSSTVDNVLKLTYYLGWGVCNEASIMICVALPFTYYLIGSSTTIKNMLFNHIKVLFMLAGVLLTTSRGGLIISTLEAIALMISLFFVSKNKRLAIKVNASYLIAILAISLICINPLIKLYEDIAKYIFTNGLDSNGRVSLWKEAYQIWTLNPRNIIFGPGMVSVIRNTNTPNGVQEGMIVFHSTLMETIAMGGIVALIALGYHFYEKYRAIYKTHDMLFFVTMLIGFLAVDFYGMVDNTYHMYYYMVPLVIILASINNLNSNKEVNTF